MKLIGIVGKKRHGKNALADALGELCKAKGKTYSIIAVADSIKEKIAELYGCPLTKVEESKADPIGRKILQFTGTEWGRELYGGDIWIKRLDNKLVNLKSDYIIIPDVRFSNEADYIKSKGGMLLRVERKGFVNTDDHISEVEQDKIRVDYTLHNDNTLLWLKNQAAMLNIIT